ncbi:MAG: hypothetical protein CVV44_07905 [Spirochaetae bacterium HGW-Spirochaetae-1]|jgi:lysophospholipase L1-like esterase|nr:MAG: hypothetical protein CVV44_07905 [Spirochaetae bacterium HGW-Spirochaetae-1]
MKVVVRGGSIPAGKGVTKSYVDLLREKFSGQGIEIINISREDDTSFDGDWTFYSDIAFHQPDVLILHFGIDDAFFPVYRSEFKENLVQIIRKARSMGNIIIFLLTSQPFKNQYDMDAVNIYYRTIREVCGDLDCILVPVHTYWAGYMEEHRLEHGDLTLSDTRYPNEKGHGIIAEIVGNQLNKISGTFE